MTKGKHAQLQGLQQPPATYVAKYTLRPPFHARIVKRALGRTGTAAVLSTALNGSKQAAASLARASNDSSLMTRQVAYSEVNSR